MSTESQELALWIRERLAKILNRPQEEIPFETVLLELGIDSIQAAELSEDLEQHVGQAVDPSFIFEFPTIQALASALTGDRKVVW